MPSNRSERCDTPMCKIVELRQYTLHPGRRDELIELFDREFVEPQEAVGMQVIGQFRDVDNPDRFVWLRGFPDMVDRAAALSAFYDGPIWATHREQANATMIDFDDVLLLRPTSDGAISTGLPGRAAIDVTGDGPGLITATIHPLAPDGVADADSTFTRLVSPVLADLEVRVVGSYVTIATHNNFPALPVREHDTVLVWFAAYTSADDLQRATALRLDPHWKNDIEPVLAERQVGPTQLLRLRPTSRSRLNGMA
jgi:NIPSNAP